MRQLKIRSTQTNRQAMIYTALMSALLAAIVLPVPGNADELTACMTGLLEQASDSTTIGELREQCAGQAQQQEQAQTELAQQDDQQTAVDVRLKQDRENVLQPFTLMSHKPNYFLLGAYNSDGYNSSYFEEQYDEPSIHLDDTEAQFQISLKIPLGINLFNTFDVYAAYTNRSFWQLYNSEISSPFRETNHEPEAWVQFTPGWEIFGFKNSANAIGFVHQSNGQGGVLSRSWNRIYANFVFQRGNFAIGFCDRQKLLLSCIASSEYSIPRTG